MVANRTACFPQLCFINGLIEEIKKLGLGVTCGYVIFKFVDDTVLMDETVLDLQCAFLANLH